MRYELKGKPDFTIGHIVFDQAGEQLVVEASAMVARDASLNMQTQMRGGFLGAAKRKLLGGESIFQNTFTSTRPGETLWIAPGPEGDIEVLELDGSTNVLLNSGAFLASSPGVTFDTKWGGAKGFFSGAGLFLLNCTGQGPLFFGSYGGIHPVDVGPAGYVVDTGHIIGFTGGLDYTVDRVGGFKSLFLSGEGLIARFRGQGRVWVATRGVGSLVNFLHPYRRVQSNG